MAPWTWWAIPAPMPAASPVRDLATAISKGARRGRLPAQDRALPLDGVEGADGLAELLALPGVLDRLRQEGLQAARHLGRAREGATEPDDVAGDERGGRRGGG